MATLYRDLGDLDAAEDAAQEAAAVALEKWLDDGIPDRPGAWITTVARRKAVDRIRRERAGRDKTELLSRLEEPLHESQAASFDDGLRLFFGCCHPALNTEAQVALTLRSLGGLTTAEIARSFLVSEATMAQRIVRAKRKISSAQIPFRVPDDHELHDRLGTVHQVLYLIFNEGAYPSTGSGPTRIDLADEAIRLTSLLCELMPNDAETLGLRALFLAIHARRTARGNEPGHSVLLPDQDRSLWHADMIEAAEHSLETAMRIGPPGPFQIQAAIQSLHNTAPTSEATDWEQIALLYRRLNELTPTPIIRLNHAVAVGEFEGPGAALILLNEPTLCDALADYPHFHAARGEMLTRMGRIDDAEEALTIALQQLASEPDRHLIEQRLAALRSRG